MLEGTVLSQPGRFFRISKHHNIQKIVKIYNVPGTVAFPFLKAQLSSRPLDYPAEGKVHFWPESGKG